jgi:hypothetical protein
MEGDHDSSCNIQSDGSSSQNGALSTDEFEKQLLWSETEEDKEAYISPFDDSARNRKQGRATKMTSRGLVGIRWERQTIP